MNVCLYLQLSVYVTFRTSDFNHFAADNALRRSDRNMDLCLCVCVYEEYEHESTIKFTISRLMMHPVADNSCIVVYICMYVFVYNYNNVCIIVKAVVVTTTIQ